ncbi:MAG: hypothetical protein WCJ56_10270 [bacterium]
MSWQALQNIDRRWIYLMLGVVFIISLMLGKPQTGVVLPTVSNLYQAVENVPTDKIIFINTTFAPNTLAESGNQARAIIRHVALNHHKFAIMAVDQQGANLGKLIAQDVAEEYNLKYGEDWISFGYQLPVLAFYKSFPKDIPGTVKQDAVESKPATAENFPIMKNLKTANDIGLMVEVSASSSLFDWIQIVQPTTSPRLKLGYACTGIMASEAYPYLDSGQLVGMMPGLKGAADYEQLVDEKEKLLVGEGKLLHPYAESQTIQKLIVSPARKLMFTQSNAHVVVILLIIIGNIGFLVTRYRAKKKQQEAAE